jgi:NAD+ kinase
VTTEVSYENPSAGFQHIGVLGCSMHEDLPDCIKRLVRFAQDHKLDVYFEDHLIAETTDEVMRLDLNNQPIDLLIAIGGDGTLLRAGRMVVGRKIPVLGINIGHLGFLTALPHLEMDDRLIRVLDGDYVLDRRFMVEARVINNDDVGGNLFLAWNDFVIHKRGVAKVTRLNLRVKDDEGWQDVGSFSGDGVIIATPTGSTAYSLSAGGPIVAPLVECLIVTPICPHTLAMRPLVIPGNQILEVSPLERADGLVLTADGQMVHGFDVGTEIHITRSDVEIPLVRFADQNFFGTLQKKLNWAARPSG